MTRNSSGAISQVRVECGDADFVILQSPDSKEAVNSELRVPWSTVNRIAVFKRALVAVDEISLGIEIEGPATLEISENFIGFRNFSEALPSHLPGCLELEVWLPKIIASSATAPALFIFNRSDRKNT